MDIPEIWVMFGSLIHQDFLFEYPDFVSGLKFIIQEMSDQQRSELLGFLRTLKSSELNASELAIIWANSGSQISIDAQGVSDLLTKLTSMVEAHETRVR